MIRFLITICMVLIYHAGNAQAAEPMKKVQSQSIYAKPIQLESTTSRKVKGKESKKETNNASKAEAPRTDIQADDATNLSSQSAINLEFNAPTYWFNSYTETRNQFIAEDGVLSLAEEKELNSIILKSKTYISSSFEYNYMNLRQNRNNSEAGKYLQEATKIGGIGNHLLFSEMAWVAERLGDDSNRNLALKKYELIGNLSAIQKQMAIWSINTVESGSLIVTNGEFDTYPLWLRQSTKNVQIVSLAMLEDQLWLANTLKKWDSNLKIPANLNNARKLIDFLKSNSKRPVYLSLSIRSEILANYTDQLHPVGPIARLTNNSWNNIEALKSFYFDQSFKEFLNNGVKSNDPFIKSLANLLPGIFILKNDLVFKKDPLAPKAEEIYQQIKSITGKSIRP